MASHHVKNKIPSKSKLKIKHYIDNENYFIIMINYIT